MVFTFKEPVVKYIEVKAVSGKDFKFNWSRNEIEAAKKINYKNLWTTLFKNVTFNFRELW